ncbi:MAG: polyphosphate kinase 2 [Fulvivirga sp.]
MIQAEKSNYLSNQDLEEIKSQESLVSIAKSKGINTEKLQFELSYEQQLEALQIELVKLQHWIQEQKMRVVIIFEGRDAAGKGGTIKRFAEHLNHRSMRVVALPKPTNLERGQWYFRRYIKQLPNAGEIVFFDRSWYNRAVVEPVMGFCTNNEYQQFMRQVTEFEHMLFEDGVSLVKLWFSIDKEEQLLRFNKRNKNPLKQWKLSPVDLKGQEYWDNYTYYKEHMFAKTHTSFSPWTIIKSNVKKLSRLESIRHVLSQFEYEGKSEARTRILPDPNIVMRFHRSIYSENGYNL